MTELSLLFSKIENEIRSFREEFLNLQTGDNQISPFDEALQKTFHELTRHLQVEEREIIKQELFSLGPIDRLLQAEDITEILIQDSENIWVEQAGRLFQSPEHFLSASSYERIFEKICREAQTHISLDRPFVSTRFRDHRLSLLHKCLTQTHDQISIRRHRHSSWTLKDLHENAWARDEDLRLLKEIINENLNFLVVGATGSGKTSLLNALLAEIPRNERLIVIEDTHELSLPHPLCTRLLARQGLDSGLSPVRPEELLRCALRLRPDRLVMGEIRGEEAKDFLLLLSTGHRGSFGTLHAESSQQALMRLEMLIQMGAPHWSLETVRRLIHQCLHVIVVVDRRKDGSRYLKEIFKIQSLEAFGFTMEKLSSGTG